MISNLSTLILLPLHYYSYCITSLPLLWTSRFIAQNCSSHSQCTVVRLSGVYSHIANSYIVCAEVQFCGNYMSLWVKAAPFYSLGGREQIYILQEQLFLPIIDFILYYVCYYISSDQISSGNLKYIIHELILAEWVDKETSSDHTLGSCSPSTGKQPAFLWALNQKLSIFITISL